MTTEIRYYYANSSNQPVGPLGRRELEALIQAGVLRPESPILAERATVRQLNLSPCTPQGWTPPALPSPKSQAAEPPIPGSTDKPDLVSGGLAALWIILGLVFVVVVIRFFSWTAFVAAIPFVLLLAALRGIPRLLSQRRREARRQKQ